MSEYISQSYYYDKLSFEFKLTVNYICSIICSIQRDFDAFYKDVERARMNLETITLDDDTSPPPLKGSEKKQKTNDSVVEYYPSHFCDDDV